MSVIHPLHAPGITPLALGEALTQRDVGWGQFIAAEFRSGFTEDSLIGQPIHGLPPLLDVDAVVNERLDSWRAQHPSGTNPPAQQLEEARARFRREAEELLSQYTPMAREEYQSSPYAREGITWEPGMSVERAQGLAEAYDEQEFNRWLIDNHEGIGFGVSTVTGFAARLVGGALSPENFIPFAGQGMRAMAIARLGAIGGRASIGAFEGALGNALTIPMIAHSQRMIGNEFTLYDMLMDVAMGAVIGGAFGTAAGAISRAGQARREALIRANEEAILTDLRVWDEARTKIEIARRQATAGEPVNVPGVSDRTRAALLEGLSLQERVRFAAAKRQDAIEGAELEIRRLEATDAGEVLLKPETTVTPLEEGAVRGETQAVRDRARQALDRDRESRRAARLAREPERIEAESRRATEQRLGPEAGRRAADEAQDVAMRLRDMGVAPSRSRRQVRSLSRLERMALFDPSPVVKALARAEIDRRLTPPRTAAPPTPVRDVQQDIKALPAEMKEVAEQVDDSPEMRRFAELERRGDLTDAEKQEMEAAIEAQQKAARSAEAYESAVACVLG